MKTLLAVAGMVTLALSQPALAQTTEETVNAPNGVALSYHYDKSDGMVEYAAPEVSFSIGGFAIDSTAIVTRWGPRSDPGPAFVSFIVAYRGGFARYDEATSTGGEQLETMVILQDDSYCDRPGATDCIFMEVFRVFPTEQQIAELARDGSLPIEVRGQRGRTINVEVPVSYFDAVNGM